MIGESGLSADTAGRTHFPGNQYGEAGVGDVGLWGNASKG